MAQTSVEVAVPTQQDLSYEVTDHITSEGKPFKLIESETYSIALFPAQSKDDPEKKSRIKYNVRVTLKESDITFNMVINELKADGTLIAGQVGRLFEHRAMVTEWNKDQQKSFERMSIHNNRYKEIMALITAAGK